MKTMFSKLLPLVFLAMLSLAPVNAQAAGPTNGMFDCLGSLDWGCRIIGFLFQVSDNEVTYVKDNGTVVTEVQTPSIKALHAMMEFFSNALLIFASIKLLYELIQMTAESAQTGQVGGKDANKLWAPIRLVIAIGLLVPIPNNGGLNSGQMIVLQIAKWGSGMASQGWKVFTAKLADGESLTVPTPPRIKDLAYSTVRTYACQQFINYYAEKLGVPDSIVRGVQIIDNESLKVVFKNKIHDDVCGTIRYKVPLRSFANSDADATRSLEYAKENRDDYLNAEGQIATEVEAMAQPFLPDGRNLPKPATTDLDGIINNFQKQVSDRVNGSNARARAAMKDITDKIQSAANSQGWTSAGNYFLDITKAESQLINGALNIPEASGPNLEVLKKYPSANTNYEEFISHIKIGSRPQDNGGGSPISSATITATSDEKSWTDFLSGLWNSRSELPADAIFGFLDRAAISVGLWESDPKKAFGDLGGSNNPFGEIAALGHKKIRLALNYIGYAIVVTGGSALLGAFSATKVVGAAMGGLAALFMMIATLFLLAGVLLAYIVPMFPFTRFFFSILTWLGSLLEAMVLVPFMALAFLTPKGEGFAGPNTRNAFFLIFQLFLRPILCVFGLMCAMIMFYVAAKFLNAAFYQATAGVYDYAREGSAMRFMQKLVYSVMYVGLIYSAANISFKMIEHIPKHALKWMGGSASEESYDDHSNFMGIATAVGGQQLLSNLQSLPQNFMAPITKGMEAHSAGVASNKESDYKKKMLEAAQARGGGDGSPASRSGNNGGGGGGGGAGGGGAAQQAFAPFGSNDPAAGNEADFAAGPAGLMRASQSDAEQQNILASGPAGFGRLQQQVFNDPIRASAGQTVAPEVQAIAQTAARQLSPPRAALFSNAISQIYSQGGLTNARETDAASNAISSHLGSNPNDVDGAVVLGLQARDRVRNSTTT